MTDITISVDFENIRNALDDLADEFDPRQTRSIIRRAITAATREAFKPTTRRLKSRSRSISKSLARSAATRNMPKNLRRRNRVKKGAPAISSGYFPRVGRNRYHQGSGYSEVKHAGNILMI